MRDLDESFPSVHRQGLDSGEGRQRGVLFLTVTVALISMIVPLNSTMVAVALPDIRDDLGVSRGAVAWLISAYLIAMAIAQPLGGRIGDQVGRARTLKAGLVAFFGLSVAAAVAPGFEILMVCRTAQALVGAAVMPNGLAMLRNTVPARQLGQTTGSVSAMTGVAAALGPVIGAGLVEAGDWRWLFFANLPLVGVALLSVLFLNYREAQAESRLDIDVPGALSLAGLLALATLLLNSGRELGVAALVASAGGLIILAVYFARRQIRSASPVAEWSLFRRRSFAASTACLMLTNLGMYTSSLTIPFFVVDLQGRSTALAGTLFTMTTVLMAVLAPAAGRLSDTAGRRVPPIIGCAFQTAGAAIFFVGVSEDASIAFLSVCMLVLGLGYALAHGPTTTAAIEAAPRERAGAAAGTNSMMRYFGSIFGVAVLGGILGQDGATPDVDSFRAVYAVLIAGGLLAMLAATQIHRFATETATARKIVPEVRTAGPDVVPAEHG